ncbi:MAG: DUF2865 domain-containing protein [Pseudomonadota bacterium]
MHGVSRLHFSAALSVGLVAVLAVHATVVAWHVGVSGSNANKSASHVTEERLLNDGWLRDVRRQFSRQRSRRPILNREWRSSLGGASPWSWLDSGSSHRSPNASVPYRTLCVRMCDGYYFPISASTKRWRFRKDARACASRCGAPTRLFYYPVNADPSQMVDLSGRAYAKLPTAFLYRTAYNSGCKCRANPWEAAAKKRHEMYALQRERRKARRDRQKRRELTRKIRDMKVSLREAKRAERAESRAITKRALDTASASALADRVDKYLVTRPPAMSVYVGRSDRRRRGYYDDGPTPRVAPPSNPFFAQPKDAPRARRFRPPMALGATRRRSDSQRRRVNRRSTGYRSNRNRSWRNRAFSKD